MSAERLVLIGALGLAAATAASSSTTDDARLASAVGMVVCSRDFGGRTITVRGTGTLVGSGSTILTVGHNFFLGGRGGRQRLEFEFDQDCVFRQHGANGALIAEVRFTRASFGEYERNPGSPNQDWAVLRTAEPLPEPARPLPFAAVDPERLSDPAGLPIAVLAFRAQRQSVPSTPLLSEGALFATDYAGFRRLAHTAPTDDMASGAALIHRTADGRNVVVAIHRSSAEFGDFNLAVPLSAELVEALRSHALGEAPAFRQRNAYRAPSGGASDSGPGPARRLL
jgi:hypothetical protein